jgi:hypothetical protein
VEKEEYAEVQEEMVWKIMRMDDVESEEKKAAHY